MRWNDWNVWNELWCWKMQVHCASVSAQYSVQYIVRAVRGQRGDEVIISRECSNTHNTPIAYTHNRRRHSFRFAPVKSGYSYNYSSSMTLKRIPACPPAIMLHTHPTVDVDVDVDA